MTESPLHHAGALATEFSGGSLHTPEGAAARTPEAITVLTPVHPIQAGASAAMAPTGEQTAMCGPQNEQAVIASGMHAVSSAAATDHILAGLLNALAHGVYESPGLHADGDGDSSGESRTRVNISITAVIRQQLLEA